MKDEISKRFDEKLPQKGRGLYLTYTRDEIKDFLDSELERQEKGLRLDERSVLDLLCEWLECSDCTRSKLGGVAFLLCQLQEGKDG